VTDYQSILEGYRARIARLESQARKLREEFPLKSDEADAAEREATALRVTLSQTMRGYCPEAADEDEKDESEEQERLEIEMEKQRQAEYDSGCGDEG
jgi:hypothetical protein